MSEIKELKNFFIDTVVPVVEKTEIFTNGQEEPVGSVDGEAQVQIIRYSVLGSTAEDAFHRFIAEEAGVEVERTDPTEFIVIGINAGSNPFG